MHPHNEYQWIPSEQALKDVRFIVLGFDASYLICSVCITYAAHAEARNKQLVANPYSTRSPCIVSSDLMR